MLLCATVNHSFSPYKTCLFWQYQEFYCFMESALNPEQYTYINFR